MFFETKYFLVLNVFWNDHSLYFISEVNLPNGSRNFQTQCLFLFTFSFTPEWWCKNAKASYTPMIDLWAAVTWVETPTALVQGTFQHHLLNLRCSIFVSLLNLCFFFTISKPIRPSFGGCLFGVIYVCNDVHLVTHNHIVSTFLCMWYANDV